VPLARAVFIGSAPAGRWRDAPNFPACTALWLGPASGPGDAHRLCRRSRFFFFPSIDRRIFDCADKDMRQAGGV
jgi:hypothetical protein